MVESGPRQLVSTKTAHIKGYLVECSSQLKMCGTEVRDMNGIHMLFPMYFRASEAFVEGVNAVESYFFASLDLFISRVPYEGFYFSITEVFLCSSYLP